MRYKRVGDVIAVALTSGDEVIESLKKVCITEKVNSGVISGIGATNFAEIGLLNGDKRTYTKRIVSEDIEISNLTGNITKKEGEIYVHLHGTLTGIDKAFGGHIFTCRISAVADIFITVITMNISREIREDGTVPMIL